LLLKPQFTPGQPPPQHPSRCCCTPPHLPSLLFTLLHIHSPSHSLFPRLSSVPSHTSPPVSVVRGFLVVHSLTHPHPERHHTTPRSPQRWVSATFRRYAQRRRYHYARWWASRRSTVAPAYKQTATRERLRSQTRSSSRRRTTSCISWLW
jgi:hypothetical protein